MRDINYIQGSFGMRRSLIAILSILMILGGSSVIHGEEETIDSPMSNDLTLPISILNDTHLMEIAVQEGWEGTGIKEDPVVIKDLLLDGTGHGNIMNIGNTRSHLNIRNCTFMNVSDPHNIFITGLRLHNTTNITISSCDFINNSRGLDIVDSENITIINSNYSRNFYGIFLGGTNITINNCTIGSSEFGINFMGENIRITNCSIFNATQFGVSSTQNWNSEISYNDLTNITGTAIQGYWLNVNIQVHHNNISNCRSGIRIYSGADLNSPPYNSSINNNTLINTTYAIFCDRYFNITDNDLIGGYQGLVAKGWGNRFRLIDNTIYGFSDYGMWTHDRSHVEGNIVGKCNRGIVITGSQVTLKNNIARNNTQHGFDIMGDSHIIEDNVATGNTGNGIFLNASKNLTLKNVMVDDNRLNGISAYRVIHTNCTNMDMLENRKYGIEIIESDHLRIENSYSYENGVAQAFIDRSDSILLTGNSFFLADMGMQVINYTSNLSVENCAFTNMNTGMLVIGPNGIRMKNCQFWGCGMDFEIGDGWKYDLSEIDIDDSNSVNGRTLLFLNESSTSSTFRGGSGQIIIYRSDDHSLSEMDLSSTTTGIQVFSSSGIVFTNISLDGDTKGAVFHDSKECTINLGSLDGNKNGMEIFSSQDITIQGCKFTRQSGLGLFIGNTCTSNTIKNNLFFGSTGTDSYAIWNYGYQSKIYLNQFIFNRDTGDSLSPDRTQVWDDGQQSEWKFASWGNYWRDLHEPDTNDDGYVDVSYLIEPDNRFYDPYPATSCPLFDPPVLNVEGDPANMSLVLKWTAPNLKGWSTFKKFNIYRMNGTDEPFFIGSASPYSRIYIDTTVKLGTDYGYIVTAVNEYTESDPSLMVRAEVDQNPPLLEITSPKQGEVIGDDVIITEWVGEDNESGIDHFEVKMDLGDWIDVGNVSNYSYFDLVEGTHIFKVKATDLTGKERIEQVTFLIDRGRPTVTINSPSDGSIINTNYTTIRWSATDDLSMVSRYKYSLDGGNMTDVGTMSTINVINLSEGSHDIEVKAYDQAGNENSTITMFTVDTISPEISIISPPFGDLTSDRDIEVVWSASDTGTGIFNFEAQIDDQPWIDTGLRTKRSFYQVTDGQHTIRVRVKDHAGNSNSDEVMVTIDASPPDLEITFPIPGAHLSQSPVTVQWDVSDEIAGMESVQFRDNQSGWRNVTENRYPLPALEEGTYRVWVRAFDKVGNSIETTTTFTIDRTPPEILEYGPVEDDSALDSSIFVSFSERMARESLSFEVEGVSGSVIWRGERAIFQPNSGSLEPGKQYNVSVRGSDLAGNLVRPISWTFNTTIYGKVRGRAVSDNGLSLPDVEVTIDGQTVLTRPDGGFFIEVTYGTHELILEKDGYKRQVIDVNITAGATLEMGDIEMEEMDDDSINPLQLLLIPAAILLMVLLIFFGATFFSRRMKIDIEE